MSSLSSLVLAFKKVIDSKDVNQVQNFLDANPSIDVNTVTFDYGWYAIHWSAYKGDLKTCEYLVEVKHANVNCENNDRDNPLIMAAFQGQLEVVVWLMTKGANVNWQNENGVNAMMMAARWGRMEVVRALVEQGHADCNLKDSQGQTALDKAKKGDKTAVIEYLTHLTTSFSKPSSAPASSSCCCCC
jgi:ankyrin repeat protein